MRACAILLESMVLSLWMSSGRTTPATISSRISKLTRQLAGQDSRRGTLDQFAAEKIGDARVFLALAAALGVIGDVGLVGDIHRHRQEIADARGALVLEERA